VWCVNHKKQSNTLQCLRTILIANVAHCHPPKSWACRSAGRRAGEQQMMEDTPSQRADSVLAAAALRVLATEHLYDESFLDECKREIVPRLSRNL